MKNIIAYIVLIGLLFTGCEYEVIDSKPGESIDPVTNLAASVDGSDVVLNWNLPSSYPADILQPVSVLVQIYTVDDSETPSITGLVKSSEEEVGDAPVTYAYEGYDVDQSYVFVVKVKGEVDVTKYPNPDYQSATRYSLGVSVAFN
jgi:hypothetical protein